MYRCDYCGEFFAEPMKRQEQENLDGENGWWCGTVPVCPACGSEYIEEVDDAEDED
jgi:hypothetical protein